MKKKKKKKSKRGIRNSEFRNQNSEFGIRNSEFGIRNSEFRIRNSEFRIRNSEFGIPGPISTKPATFNHILGPIIICLRNDCVLTLTYFMTISNYVTGFFHVV